MNTPVLRPSVFHPPALSVACLALLMLPVTRASAQRETFDASDYRREPAISAALDKAPARQVKRKGAAPDGRPVTVTATNVAVSFENVYFRLDSTELRDKASGMQVA